LRDVESGVVMGGGGVDDGEPEAMAIVADTTVTAPERFAQFLDGCRVEGDGAVADP
jgi:hypothetical protein